MWWGHAICAMCFNRCVKNTSMHVWKTMFSENFCRNVRYANVNFLICRDCSIKADLSGTLVSPAYVFHLNAAQRPTPWVTFKHRWKRSSLGKALLLAQITKQQSLYCSPVRQSPPERIHLVIRAKWLRSFPFIIAINLLNPISNRGGKDVVSNYRDVS